LHNELGVLYWILGDEVMAEKNFDSAIHATVPYYSNEKRSILNNYGCMCVLRKKRTDSGIEYLREALKINISNEGLGVIANNLASVYLFQAKYQEAYDLLVAAEAFLPQSGIHNLKLLRQVAEDPNAPVQLSDFNAKCELQIFK
jgi:tetratricopeptide (TPR) repeat protein